MKTLLFIVLLLVTIVSFSRADKIDAKEPEIINKFSIIDGHNFYIACFDGYRYVITRVSGGTNVTQMFKENDNNRSVPVSCR